MNPIREWIESVLRIARDQAEYGEFDRRIQRLLFLFAIEIGQGRRLTAKERERYAATMLTAEAFLAVTEKHPQSSTNRLEHEQILTECIANWQMHEPKLRRLLERMLGERFQAFDTPIGMWPAISDMFEDQFRALSHAFPEQLPPRELPVILERLHHPLDRA